jgi:hypothetical protein
MSAAPCPIRIRACRRAVLFVSACFLLLATVISTGSLALAQDDARAKLLEDYPDWKYPVIPVPEELLDKRYPEKVRVERAERTMRLLIQRIFNNTDPSSDKSLAANEAKFDQYFRDLLFRRWTHPQNLTKIQEDRVLILRFLSLSKNPAANERLHSLIRENMPKIASGNFHPALRYNAMLLLGSLNSKEAVIYGNKSPAIPLIDILPGLLEEVTSKDQIDAVRVAALIGVQRHAEGNLSAGAKQEVINRLLPIVTSGPPQGRTPEGHAWIQRQVINILAAMRSPGMGGAVINGLRSLVVDPDKPLSLRCAAAAALGTVGIGSLDPKEVAGEVGAVGVEACRVELTWLRDHTEERLAVLKSNEDDERRSDRDAEAALFGGGGGETISTAGDPVLARLDDLSRRRLKTRLNKVRTALGGPGRDPRGISAAAGPAGPDVSQLAKIIDAIMKALEDTESSPDDMQQSVYEGATKLDAQVKKMIGTEAAAPAESTTPAPDESGPDGPPDDGPPGPGDESGPDL